MEWPLGLCNMQDGLLISPAAFGHHTAEANLDIPGTVPYKSPSTFMEHIP